MLENKSSGSNSFRRVNRIHEVKNPPEEVFLPEVACGACRSSSDTCRVSFPRKPEEPMAPSDTTQGEYDGYAECVRTLFDPEVVSIAQLMEYFFEIIDPYSLNKQGPDEGEKYRTGVYSREQSHLSAASRFIEKRKDAARIVVEIKPLTNHVRSAEEHQDRLTLHPQDHCHLASNFFTSTKTSR